MSDYEFFLSIGGVPTFVAGAGPEDAQADPCAVASWNFGWEARPENVRDCVAAVAAVQESPVLFAGTEAGADPVKGDETVLLWLAEDKVRSAKRPSWNQGQVGTCVSFGFGRGCNDLVMLMAAEGLIEAPPEDVATEPIYGGSRVEVGGGQIGGDGSVGAWAAKWLRDWGVLLRKVYGSHDLTRYSESLSRSWGRSGVPDVLEPLARERPVKSVAQVRTGLEAWNAIGSGYPVPPCSNRGFTTKLDEGFCSPSGSWNHCMLFRGRVVAKRRGSLVKALACQNSWGGYLSGERSFEDAAGVRHELPEGCFLVDLAVADAMLRQDDSFALSSLSGFPKRDDLSWLA